jgi:hypothetical protein
VSKPHCALCDKILRIDGRALELFNANHQLLRFVDSAANCICGKDHGAGHFLDCPVPALRALLASVEGGGK